MGVSELNQNTNNTALNEIYNRLQRINPERSLQRSVRFSNAGNTAGALSCTAQSSSRTAPGSWWARVRDVSTAAEDSLLGLGHYVSRLAENSLPQLIAPRIRIIGAGLGRAAGGLLSAAGAGYRIMQAAREDLSSNDYSLSRTRRESTVSAAAIASGALAGEAGYLATSAAIAAGAPSALIIAMGAAAIAGAGYAAYQVRESIGGYYDRIMN